MTPPVGYAVRVQFGTFFGQPVWVDVTPWADIAALTISRGRQDEAGQVTPGRLEVPLSNDDGRFTPERPASPYYPHVLDGAPVEVMGYVAAPDGNLEDNPSHELGVGEWRVGGFGTPPTVAPSTVRILGDGGGWSMLITWASGTSFAGAQRTLYGLQAGQQYTWSRYVWVPAGSPPVVLDSMGLGSGSASAVTGAWTRLTVTFVATGSSQVLQVASTTTAAGQCWTDAGRLDAGPVALPVTGPAGARRSPRFYGEAKEWPLSGWAGPALTARSNLVAVDVPGRLGDRSRQLKAFDVEEALLDGPVVLLPLDEPAEATQAGNLGSGQRAAVLIDRGGTAEFGAGTGPPGDGAASLVLTRASATAGHYLRASCEVLSDALTVEAFINTTQTECLIANAAIAITGDPFYGYGMSLKITSNGKLEWRSDGNLIVTSAQTVTDGQTHHVAAVYRHTGTQHTATLYIDGVADGAGAQSTALMWVSSHWLLVGGSPKLAFFSGTINHVAVYGSALTAARLAAHAAAGLTAFGGERSDQRISRLSSYADLQSLTPAARPGVWVLDSATASVLGSSTVVADTDLDVETGSAQVWGQGAGGFAPLAGMEQVAATEGGLVLADREGFLRFHGRAHRYNRAPVARIDLADGDVQPDLEVGFDDADVANDVTVTTEDGAEVRYVDQASVDQRGRYGGAGMSVLTRDATDAFSAASWRVTRHTRPRARYRRVTVDLTAVPAELAAQVLAVDVGDRLDLINLPDQAPASTAALFVEGYTEQSSADGLQVSFTTSTADGYQVWVLDNPSLAVLDSSTVLAW